jgi:hypothetical protein
MKALNLATYQRIIVHLVSYLDHVQYPKNTVFERGRLAEITGDDVLRWMNVQCFRHPDPPLDARPCRRSSTMLYYKKALSHFMPNRNMVWNEITSMGNPTKYQKILDLIGLIKQMEVRHQGCPSQARRSLTDPEYIHTIEMLHARESLVEKYGMPAMLSFQFAMIARVDDASQFLRENLQSHHRFPGMALKCRLTWSKNVMDERAAPWQTLLGSMNPYYCVLVNLAIWLEASLLANANTWQSPYIFAFSPDHEVPSGGNKSKAKVQRVVKEIFKGEFFATDSPIAIGTHSFRKYAATYCRNCGASKDDKDLRGRWKSGGRVSDVYDDTDLPFIDMKVCAMLCVGGPCSYVVEADGIDNDFIVQNVVPNIAAKFGEAVALVLGRALLWTVFSDKAEWVPGVIQTRVQAAYHGLPTHLEAGQNPVRKTLLVVAIAGNGQTVVTKIGEGGAAHGGNAGGGQQESGVSRANKFWPCWPKTRNSSIPLQHCKTNWCKTVH